MKKKRKNAEELQQLAAISNNQFAMNEGPKKKRWTRHDLKQIQPLTDTQSNIFKAYYQGDNIVAYGSAGTGKSFLALYLGLSDIIQPSPKHDNLIIVRSAVASREIGHLPGDLDEKMAVYESPYKDMCAELFIRPSTYDDMKTAGLIRFLSTSYIRGSTWDDSVIVVDEAQNMTWHEINSIMTRVGQNSRVIFTGDVLQTDLNRRNNDVSGMDRLIRTSEIMKEFSTVQFTVQDIVRSELVKSWIIASEGTA